MTEQTTRSTICEWNQIKTPITNNLGDHAIKAHSVVPKCDIVFSSVIRHKDIWGSIVGTVNDIKSDICDKIKMDGLK